MIAPPKPPTHDELEALIKEARARQLRRRLLGAAAVAVAAAVGLSIYAFVSGGKLDNIAQTPAQGGRASGPLCRASQLVATAGLNGATGTMMGPATLTNTSGSACSLPSGRPRVRILLQGRVLPARETGEMDISGETPVRVLAPRSKAAIFMDWSNWCGKPSEGTIIRPTFQLSWADGLGVDAPNHAMTPPRCNSPGSGTSVSTIDVSTPVADR
ncbi:MAG: DUF4232 domain-containing protein [Gaiellaceae bacterium]